MNRIVFSYGYCYTEITFHRFFYVDMAQVFCFFYLKHFDRSFLLYYAPCHYRYVPATVHIVHSTDRSDDKHDASQSSFSQSKQHSQHVLWFWICFPTHMYSKISLFPIKFEFRCTYTVPNVLIYQNEMILIINNFLRHASELLKCSFMSVNYILCRERTIQPYDRFIPRVGQAQSK